MCDELGTLLRGYAFGMVAEHGPGQQCRAAALTLKLGEINKPISVIDQCQLGGTITQGSAAAVPKGVTSTPVELWEQAALILLAL